MLKENTRQVCELCAEYCVPLMSLSVWNLAPFPSLLQMHVAR